MKKLIVLFAIAALAIVVPSLSYAVPGGEGNNTGCNGQGNPNSPCEGNSNSNDVSNSNQVNVNSRNKNINRNSNRNTNVNNNESRANANSNSSVKNTSVNTLGQEQSQSANNDVNVVDSSDNSSIYMAPPATTPLVGTASAQVTTPFGGIGFSKDAKHAKLISTIEFVGTLQKSGVLTEEEARNDSRNLYKKLLKTVCGRSCSNTDKE